VEGICDKETRLPNIDNKKLKRGITARGEVKGSRERVEGHKEKDQEETRRKRAEIDREVGTKGKHRKRRDGSKTSGGTSLRLASGRKKEKLRPNLKNRRAISYLLKLRKVIRKSKEGKTGAKWKRYDVQGKERQTAGQRKKENPGGVGVRVRKGERPGKEGNVEN